MTAAALLDLDRTLVAGSSGFYWARAAVDAGIVSRAQMARIVWENARFRLRGSTDESTARVRGQIAQIVEGERAIDLRRMMPEVLAAILPRIYPQMLRIAYEHQDAGRRVYIATASSQELAEMLSHVLGFDGGIGARSEIVDGRFTGRDADIFTYRDGKAQRIRELAEREGIDLAASYAYSDSESDLPMLRLVGHPVAVNPDAELERVALEEGWELLRFERLGRRLVALGALFAMGLVGTAGRVAASRRVAGPPPATPRARAPRRDR
ncbi:MAG: HAD-IB family hydrolase [Solirubrobacteraceae bacterium]|nr:HAD-IB family hydrolase [Solirubrobacteraceae bacterium]